jgi:hypothetical protein
MECEGEQVEGDEDAGEAVGAVPKIVFEVVSVGLEDVEGLVLIFQRARPQAIS